MNITADYEKRLKSMKIECGVKIPRRVSQLTTMLENVKRGQSVFFPNMKSTQQITYAVDRVWGADGGVRVWRVRPRK